MHEGDLASARWTEAELTAQGGGLEQRPEAVVQRGLQVGTAELAAHFGGEFGTGQAAAPEQRADHIGDLVHVLFGGGEAVRTPVLVIHGQRRGQEGVGPAREQVQGAAHCPGLHQGTAFQQIGPDALPVGSLDSDG